MFGGSQRLGPRTTSARPNQAPRRESRREREHQIVLSFGADDHNVAWREAIEKDAAAEGR